jgi:hypothetical protein
VFLWPCYTFSTIELFLLPLLCSDHVVTFHTDQIGALDWTLHAIYKFFICNRNTRGDCLRLCTNSSIPLCLPRLFAPYSSFHFDLSLSIWSSANFAAAKLLLYNDIVKWHCDSPFIGLLFDFVGLPAAAAAVVSAVRQQLLDWVKIRHRTWIFTSCLISYVMAIDLPLDPCLSTPSTIFDRMPTPTSSMYCRLTLWRWHSHR